MSERSNLWFPLLGLGFAVAGIDKLFRTRGYRRAFRRLGWSEEQMRAIGAAEIAGGVMVATPSTRLIGGAVLAITSAAVLTSELNARDEQLAMPRLALLGAALTAFAPSRERDTA